MSRSELADAVNRALDRLYANRRLAALYVDSRWVGKIERGESRWPSEERRAGLRDVFGVASDIELDLFSPRRTEAARQKSREVDGQLLVMATHLIPDIEEVELHHSSGMIGDIEAELASPASSWNSFSVVTTMLAEQRQAVAPKALLALVEAHRDCLSTLYRKTKTRDAVRSDIGVMLGEASIVASRLWSAQGNTRLALAHCAYARTLADRFGSSALGATARMFESNLHSEASGLMDAGGDIVTGLKLLDEAAAASAHLSPAARARVAAEQAQAFAALSLPREAKLALERAHEAAEQINADGRTGLFSDWTPQRLAVYEGTCHLLLGESIEALSTLEAAVDNLQSDHNNVNVLLAAKVDLAHAYAKNDELPESCRILGETFQQMLQVGNLRGIRRARLVRTYLNRWNSEPALRQLDAAMSAA